MLDFNILGFLMDFLLSALNDNILHFFQGLADVVNPITPNPAGGGADQLTQYVDELGARVVDELYRLTDTYFTHRSATGAARQILAIGVLFYLGYEMWPVIMGRKTPDVVALLRPFLLAHVIIFWGTFVALLRSPGLTLKDEGKTFYKGQWSKMGNVAVRCDELQFRLNQIRDSLLADDLQKLQVMKEAATSWANYQTNHEDGEAWYEWVYHEIGDLWDGNGMQWLDRFKDGFDVTLKMIAEVMTKVLDDLSQVIMGWIEKIIKWISVIFLNFNFIGILMIGQIGMGILGIVGPIMFGMSIFEVWHNAWAEWMMKFFSYSLYGWLAYTVMGYCYGLVYFEMQAYEKTLQKAINTSGAANGLNEWAPSFAGQLGVTLNWVVCLWVGGYAMKFVPELAGVICSAPGSSAAAGAADAMKGGVKGTINLIKK